jgi:hypothetical protein
MMKIERFTLIMAALLLAGLSITGSAFGAGQEDEPVWNGAVAFANGINVQTGQGTIPPQAAGLRLSNNRTEAGGAANSPENSLRRILTLSDGRAIVYELLINPVESGARFEVKIQPVTLTAAQAKKWGIDLKRVEINFFKNYAAPIFVASGDTLAIDVLINTQTGVKLVDYYRISNKPLIEERNPITLASSARQLKAEDIELSVFKYELRLNGETVYKSGGGFRGRFVWMDIPKVGRFLFSLAQAEAEAEGFLPSAFVSEHQIVFTHAGNRYELVADEPIVPGSGVFYLWMLHDPTFTIPSQENLPPEFGGEPVKYGRFGAANNLAPIKKRE